MSRRHVWPRTTGLVLATVAMAALLRAQRVRPVGRHDHHRRRRRAGHAWPGLHASLRGNVKAIADAAGNLYVSDGFGHRVYRLDAASGVLSPLAGDGFSGVFGRRRPGAPGPPRQSLRPGARPGTEPALHRRLDHNVIRAVDLASGVISTVAGTGACGTPATTVRPPARSSATSFPTSPSMWTARSTSPPTSAAGASGPCENGVIRTVAGNGVARGDRSTARAAIPPTTTGTPCPRPALRWARSPPSRRSSPAQSLYFYEQAALAVGGARFRRVDLGTGMLTTYAGNGLLYGQIDGLGGDPADDVVEGAPPCNPRSATRRRWPSTRRAATSTRRSTPSAWCDASPRNGSGGGNHRDRRGRRREPAAERPPVGRGPYQPDRRQPRRRRHPLHRGGLTPR